MITKPPVIYGKYSLFQKIKKNSKKVLTIMDNFGKIIFADAPEGARRSTVEVTRCLVFKAS